MPRTNFYQDNENQIVRLFWGRIQLSNGLSVFQFNQEGVLQHLIHALKYQGQKDVGIFLGREIGKAILSSKEWEKPDVIVPIPLHEKKQHKRGYNQSEFIAEGIAEILKIPAILDAVERIDDTESQTQKAKFERWENVATVFSISQPNKLANKHVLLVDDVVTTGATIEACGNKILAVNGTKISIAAAAHG